MFALRRRALTGAGLALVIVSPAAFGMGVLPNCLDELALRTKSWSECTEVFDRQDSRCRNATQAMHQSMERCEAKGYRKAQIDAAMSKGYRSAGSNAQIPNPAPAAPARPAPKAKRGPIPGVEAPDS